MPQVPSKQIVLRKVNTYDILYGAKNQVLPYWVWCFFMFDYDIDTDGSVHPVPFYVTVEGDCSDTLSPSPSPLPVIGEESCQECGEARSARSERSPHGWQDSSPFAGGATAEASGYHGADTLEPEPESPGFSSSLDPTGISRTIPSQGLYEDALSYWPLFEGGRLTYDEFCGRVENVIFKRAHCGQGRTVLNSDCGAMRVVPYHCGQKSSCPSCTEDWKREVIPNVEAVVKYAKANGHRTVFITFTLKERGGIGFDRWSSVLGKFFDSRVPVNWREVLDKSLLVSDLTESQKALQRFLSEDFGLWVDDWYEVNGFDGNGKRRYLKIRDLLPAVYHILQGSFSNMALHPHVHAVCSIPAPIPQVLLSALWVKCSGAEVLDIRLLYGNPRKVGRYVARYMGRSGKDNKDEIPLPLLVCIDAYLFRRQRRKWSGPDWKSACALVEHQKRSDYVCPYCHNPDCKCHYLGKVDGYVSIEVGKIFTASVGNYTVPLEIVDDTGRCDFLEDSS